MNMHPSIAPCINSGIYRLPHLKKCEGGLRDEYTQGDARGPERQHDQYRNTGCLNSDSTTTIDTMFLKTIGVPLRSHVLTANRHAPPKVVLCERDPQFALSNGPMRFVPSLHKVQLTRTSANHRSIRHAQLLLLVCKRILACLEFRFCKSRRCCLWWMVI